MSLDEIMDPQVPPNHEECVETSNPLTPGAHLDAQNSPYMDHLYSPCVSISSVQPPFDPPPSPRQLEEGSSNSPRHGTPRQFDEQ